MTTLAAKDAPSALIPMPKGPSRDQVVALLVAAIERSPLIDRVSTDKLRAQAEDRFERFCDGRTFDLRPIVTAIVRAGLGRPEECLFIVGFAKAALASLGLEVKEPELEVSPKTRARIVKEAEGAFAAWQKKARPARMPLGQILVENRLLSAPQLKAALLQQRSVGGRLGTHLVRLGFLPAPALAHYLGLQLNQPAADLAQLKRLSVDALAAVPADLIREHRVFPLSLKSGMIRLAMVDPSDRLAIDQITHRTGLRVMAMVAPESLIEELIERHYGRPRTLSLVEVPTTEEPFEVVHTSQKRDRPAPHAIAVVEPIDEDEVEPATVTHEAPEEGGPKIRVEDRGDFCASHRPDLELEAHGSERLGNELIAAESVVEILGAAAKQLSIRLSRVAAFEVSGTRATGALHVGCTLSPEALKQVTIAVDRSPCFWAAAKDGVAITKSTDGSLLDQALAAKLGISSDSLAVVVPIKRGDQVVGMLFAGQPKSVGALPDPTTLQTLVDKCATAVQLLGLKAKLRA